MKKAVLLVAALVMICSFAFAAEPKAELKITTFSGSCAVTLGVDLGTGSIAFNNADVDADLVVDLVSAGDKSTTGEGIWGELKIKTDGDPIQIKTEDGVKVSDYTTQNPTGFKVIVDVAKLHIGSMAYIGLKSDSTNIDYVMLPYEAAAVYVVDVDQPYGQIANALPAGTVLQDAGVGTGANATQGIVAGINLPNLVDVDVDFRSMNKWNDDPGAAVLAGSQLTASADDMNRFGIRGKVSVTAVPNLTLQAGAGTGFGGTNWLYDIGFGGKVAYKIALNDKMSVTPTVAVNAVLDNADTDASVTAGTGDIGFIAQAGALLGWGDKTKLNLYFSPDNNDSDWMYFPGIAAGVQVTSKKVFATTNANDYIIGLNVSAFSGTLIENLSANAALEIRDLMASQMTMGATANLKYDIKMDPMVISPKLGVYFLSDPAGAIKIGAATDEEKTDIYLKAGVDIAKIFPNTTLSFQYSSNDFSGGVSDTAAASADNWHKALGALTTTLKISF